MKPPKEQAESLVNEIRMILMDEDTECGNEVLCTLIAQKIAVIEVKNIYKALVFNQGLEHWKQVEQAIERI